jgi:hypothetical protein
LERLEKASLAHAGEDIGAGNAPTGETLAPHEAAEFVDRCIEQVQRLRCGATLEPRCQELLAAGHGPPCVR